MKIRLSVLLIPLVLPIIINGCRDKKAGQLPIPEVRVVKVMQQDIPVIEEFVGQTYGLFDISILARVEGFLEGIHFIEGTRVKKGQLLYTIDSQPFEVRVAGYMSQLAEANTLLVKAENDLARIRPLAEMSAVSKSDLDAAIARRDAAKASVEAAEASLKSARIELGYTRIFSPIDGIIGKTEAYPGDFVGRGFDNMVLNEVSRIDTILVNFHLAEEKYLKLVRPLLIGNEDLRIQRKEDQQGMTMILADGFTYPYKGRIRFVNRQVNATTGTILLQASFPNPNNILRPGQFARVKAVIDVIEGGLVIPQRCVQELQGNYNVFVVGEEDRVEFRKITVAGTYNTSFFIVDSGLKPGERIIYEGLQKAGNGDKVNPILQEISELTSEN